MRDATRVTRAGDPEPSQGTPFLPGPTFASKYHLFGDPSSSEYTYGRNNNPTWTRFESALAELEGGPSVVFSSGMAAITALLSETLLRETPHPVLVMPSDGYNLARKLVREHFERLGVDVRWTPTRGDGADAPLEGARLVWLESPSNPRLDVLDLSAWIGRAHAAGALVAVDNTTAGFLAQRPLELGADFSVASDSKTLTGHSDLILGHVAAREASWAGRLREFRGQQGAVPGPMEVWLAHRSLATLDVRLERQCANALALAHFLRSRPEVRDVRYPGLPDDPSYPIAARQMRHFGPLVGFALPSEAIADAFLRRCRVIRSATSFGGVHTTAERRGRWKADDVAAGFIRLSAGCEDRADIEEDIARALSAG